MGVVTCCGKWLELFLGGSSQPIEVKMNNLKKIINEKGVKIARMARETGYSSPAICHWMSERTIPNLYAARDVAEYLGVTDRDIWQ